VVSGVGDRGFSDDGGCSVMNVDGNVLGSGLSCMWIMGISLTIEWV
jgi:hypothetical protein